MYLALKALHFKEIVAVLYWLFDQFLSNISPFVLFFDKKHKSTDWCSIEGGVPSDGENRVHCFYFAVFTYAQLAARFPIGNCHLFAWNRNRNRHFFSGIPESQNPGILVELVESLPLFFLESYQNPRIPETQNRGILVDLVESLPLFFLESYQNPPLFFLESQQNPPLYFGIPGHMYAFASRVNFWSKN